MQKGLFAIQKGLFAIQKRFWISSLCYPEWALCQSQELRWGSMVGIFTPHTADGLEKVSIPVHIHSEVTDEQAKMAGQLLVDAKVSCWCW
jgi:hypothetical protein